MKKRKYETPSTAIVPVNSEGMLLAGSQGGNITAGTQDVQSDALGFDKGEDFEKKNEWGENLLDPIYDNPFFIDFN